MRHAAALLGCAALASAASRARLGDCALGATGARRGRTLGSGFLIPLVELGDDAYVGNVSMGSPPQSMAIQVDLMSSDLWVLANTSGLWAAPHRVFDRLQSRTYRYDGTNVTLPFTPRLNASVLVEVSDDALTLADGTALNVTFGLAVKIDPFFMETAYDGILGLGLDDLTRVSHLTVLDRLVRQHGIEPMFSLYLSRASSGGAPMQQQQQQQQQQRPLGAGAGVQTAATPSPAPSQSVLLLGDYDMRYATNTKQQPLWLPLLPASAGATGGLAAVPVPLPSDDNALPSATGFDLWRLALPHVTLDCSALSGSVVAQGATGDEALTFTDTCTGSESFVVWATEAAAEMTWQWPFIGQQAATPTADVSSGGTGDGVLARALQFVRRLASVGGAPAGSVDVCGGPSDGADAGCSAILTPSSRSVDVPIDVLPQLLAAVNASCGGACFVIPFRGLGVLCRVGSCGDTQVPGGGGGYVPSALPNITFTFDESPVTDGDDPTDSGDDDDDDGGSMWDVTLSPADYSLQLGPAHVRGELAAALRSPRGRALPSAARARLTGLLDRFEREARAASGAAASAQQPQKAGPPSGYHRVLLGAFSPPPGAGPAHAWVLGTPILQVLYSIYDASCMQVGLAEAIAGHALTPSRYNDSPDAGWTGFFGSGAMWITVGAVLAAGLASVFLVSRFRRKRRAARAAAFEREYRERLLLGLPVSGQPLDGAGDDHGGDGELEYTRSHEGGGLGAYSLMFPGGGVVPHDASEIMIPAAGGRPPQASGAYYRDSHHHHRGAYSAPHGGGGDGYISHGGGGDGSDGSSVAFGAASGTWDASVHGGHGQQEVPAGWAGGRSLATERSFHHHGAGTVRPTFTPVAVSLTRPEFAQQAQQQQQPVGALLHHQSRGASSSVGRGAAATTSSAAVRGHLLPPVHEAAQGGGLSGKHQLDAGPPPPPPLRPAASPSPRHGAPQSSSASARKAAPLPPPAVAVCSPSSALLDGDGCGESEEFGSAVGHGTPGGVPARPRRLDF